MPQQEQAKEGQSHKPAPHPQLDPLLEQGEMLPPLPIDLAAASAAAGVDGHALRLRSDGLKGAQRQALAGQLAQRGGNVYLNRVMSQLGHSSDAVVQRGLMDMLDLRENEAGWDLWEDYQDSQQEKREFRSGIYQELNHFPSTGRGMFNVLYSGSDGRLYITCKCKFNFIDGSSLMPNGARVALRWTDEQKQQWKDDFFQRVYNAWTGANINFYCQKDWWEDVTASVVVMFLESEESPHFVVNITKIPEGEVRGSSVSRPKAGVLGMYQPGTVTLDSEDLADRRRTGAGGETNIQTPAVHESGHMLGLADEYQDEDLPETVPHSELVRREFGHTVARGDDDRIMSQGMRITAEHGVTFLEGLRVATDMQEWGVAPKPPREVPPNPATANWGDYPTPTSDTRLA